MNSIKTLFQLAAQPLETWIRLTGKYHEHLEARGPRCEYHTTADWRARLHAAAGVSLPCGERAALDALWTEVLSSLAARRLQSGPASYLGWNDGDPALVEAIWCLIRHLKATKVVETGVGHGVTSRFALEALRLNGGGHLWSIDLPPPRNPEVHHEIGAAVGSGFAGRWSYVQGSSRRRLPRLLAEVAPIDLFIHDSLHSGHNTLFEMSQAWPALRRGGAIVVDDVDMNWGFQRFTEALPGHPALVCESDPIRPDTRRFNQKGLFGILIKAAGAS